MHSPSAFLHYSAIQSLFSRLDDMLLLLIVFQHPRPHTQERIAIPSEALRPPNTLPGSVFTPKYSECAERAPQIRYLGIGVGFAH